MLPHTGLHLHIESVDGSHPRGLRPGSGKGKWKESPRACLGFSAT